MPTCDGTTCGVGYEAALSWEASQIRGSFRSFVEVISFFVFLFGVTLNTAVLSVMISAWSIVERFDVYLMNIAAVDLLSSFGLAFVFFVQFTTRLAPIGDAGCKFLNWLAVLCVSATSAALVAAVMELHRQLRYPNENQSSRRKFIAGMVSIWVIAGVTGAPYLAASYMGPDNVCMLSRWSDESEIIFAVMLFLFQAILPIAALIYFFVHILLRFKAPRYGDAALEDDSAPGSEASLLRGIALRKVSLLLGACSFFFTLLTVVSLVDLVLILDVSSITGDTVRFSRLRVMNELLLCLKCCITPLFYLRFYDKFISRFKQLCCRRNQDTYNSLNLRYNVYQQTVLEQTVPGSTANGGAITRRHDGEHDNDEVFETERDDVAILNSSR